MGTNITLTSTEREKIELLEFESGTGKISSKGSLSVRYKAEIGGKRYFLKTFLNSNNCLGAASRSIIKNEIAVQEYIKSANGKSLYAGYLECEDVIYLKFNDIAQWNGKTLGSRIGVKDHFGNDVKPEEKKLQVSANNAETFSLEEIVHITSEVSQQANVLHNIKSSGRGGIVHIDISLSNILLYTKDNYTNVLLSDFGLARENGMSGDKLFNLSNPQLPANNDYYTTKSGFSLNVVYSPPNVETDYTEKVDPSYDTYNIANILCLMLTGKLVEAFNENNGTKPEALASKIVSEIKPKIKNGHKENLLLRLANIVAKGTAIEKEGRYKSAEELIIELNKLELAVPQEFHPPARLPEVQIPLILAKYTLKSPPIEQMQKAFGPTLENAKHNLEKLLAVKSEITPEYDLPDLLSGINEKIKQYNAGAKDVEILQSNLFWKRLRNFGLAALALVGLAFGGYYAISDWNELQRIKRATEELSPRIDKTEKGILQRIRSPVEKKPSGSNDIKPHYSGTYTGLAHRIEKIEKEKEELIKKLTGSKTLTVTVIPPSGYSDKARADAMKELLRRVNKTHAHALENELLKKQQK